MALREVAIVEAVAKLKADCAEAVRQKAKILEDLKGRTAQRQAAVAHIIRLTDDMHTVLSEALTDAVPTPSPPLPTTSISPTVARSSRGTQTGSALSDGHDTLREPSVTSSDSEPEFPLTASSPMPSPRRRYVKDRTGCGSAICSPLLVMSVLTLGDLRVRRLSSGLREIGICRRGVIRWVRVPRSGRLPNFALSLLKGKNTAELLRALSTTLRVTGPFPADQSLDDGIEAVSNRNHKLILCSRECEAIVHAATRLGKSFIFQIETWDSRGRREAEYASTAFEDFVKGYDSLYVVQPRVAPNDVRIVVALHRSGQPNVRFVSSSPRIEAQLFQPPATVIPCVCGPRDKQGGCSVFVPGARSTSAGVLVFEIPDNASFSIDGDVYGPLLVDGREHRPHSVEFGHSRGGELSSCAILIPDLLELRNTLLLQQASLYQSVCKTGVWFPLQWASWQGATMSQLQYLMKAKVDVLLDAVMDTSTQAVVDDLWADMHRALKAAVAQHTSSTRMPDPVV